ncbi:MAG: TRAP transporter small permease [Desulfomonile tiedjei]|nr:TRAP transporter small permease [Desulfomonile tiedjei]
MQRIIRALNSVEEWTLVLVLLGLAFLSFVQVFCRYVLQFSFTWMEELGRYLGVFIAFLGASLGVKYGSHFSMDLIYEKVSSDRFRHGLKVIINIASGLMFFVIAYYGWEQAMKLRRFGVLTSALEVPKYWAYLPIPFFSTIMGIRFINLGIRHLVRLVRREPFRMGPEQ